LTSAVDGGKVTAEMKFSDGTRNVVLSDLVYGEDWVLSLEKKEGTAKSKKKQPAVSKKATKATGERLKSEGKRKEKKKGGKRTRVSRCTFL
jgi:hypothetical protein